MSYNLKKLVQLLPLIVNCLIEHNMIHEVVIFF